MDKSYGSVVRGAALVLGLGATGLGAAADDVDVIEEVVVTAQFREQSVQDTPQDETAALPVTTPTSAGGSRTGPRPNRVSMDVGSSEHACVDRTPGPARVAPGRDEGAE